MDEFLQFDQRKDGTENNGNVHIHFDNSTEDKSMPTSKQPEELKKFHHEKSVAVSVTLSKNSNLLPPGWRAVQHLSGLTVYVHDETSVACWTKPYVCPKTIAIEKHCPPLSTFDPSYNPLKAEDVNTHPWHAHKSLWAKCTEAFNSSEMWKKRPRVKEVHLLGTANTPHDNPAHSSEKCKDESKSLAFFERRPRENIVINGLELPKPDCKSAITFLQDYSMNVLKCTPKYLQKQAGDGTFAYTIFLEGMEYGSGEGTTKKMARIGAAEDTLEMLIPGTWKRIIEKGKNDDDYDLSPEGKNMQHLQRFRQLSIEDPRVLKACAELSIKTPAQLLQEYQNRHSGVVVNYETEKEPTGEFNPTGLPVYQFRLVATVGAKEAKAIGTTKKQAKQFASQSLLAQLHPTDRYYYQVVERYGPRDVKRDDGNNLEYGKTKSFSSARLSRHRTAPYPLAKPNMERRRSPEGYLEKDHRDKRYTASRDFGYSRTQEYASQRGGRYADHDIATNSNPRKSSCAISESLMYSGLKDDMRKNMRGNHAA